MDYLVHHMLRNSVKRFPEKEAVVHKDQRLTFTQLQTDVNQYANLIRKSGIQKHDRVGIFLPLGIPLVNSFFACSLASAVFVPMHHSLLKTQISHIVKDCGIKTLITCQSLIDKVSPELANTNLSKIIIIDDGFKPKQLHSFDVILVSDAEKEFLCDNHCRVENDLSAILYTSGSTGMPKGVMLSHKNIMAGASIVSEYLGISDKDRILAALPFNFDAGLNQLTTSIQQGATIVLINFLFAREVVTTLNKEEITGLAGVPPFWNLMAQDNSTLIKNPSETLRYITNTGGVVAPELLEKLQNALSKTTDIVLMYGLTEAFRSTYLPAKELLTRRTSMGKAIPNTEIMVVREDGTLCHPNETGELVHHGPTVTLGYWGQPEATDQVYRSHPNPLQGIGEVDKVVYSGDLVYQDDDGYLYFVGRKDSMIKSSGFRISPTEVEAGIMQTMLVEQVAVVGVPDSVLGQKIIGFVRPINKDTFDSNDLMTASSEFLPRHMLPKMICLIDEFPKTASGKFAYQLLREKAIDIDAKGVFK